MKCKSPDMFLSCVSDLQCEVDRFVALTLGEEPLSISLPEFLPVSVLCCVIYSLFLCLTKYTVVGSALGAALTMCMSIIGPSVCSVLFSLCQ